MAKRLKLRFPVEATEYKRKFDRWGWNNRRYWFDADVVTKQGACKVMFGESGIAMTVNGLQLDDGHFGLVIKEITITSIDGGPVRADRT
jgi:hypothetical protein